MCEYRFQHSSAPHSKHCCSISSYFNHWKRLKYPVIPAPTEWSDKIPVDSNGLCLFHSGDIEWKLKNHFHSRFLQLLKIFERLTMEATREGPTQPIDLRECYFIGLPQNAPKGRSILLDNLDIFGSLHLDLQYSIFEDALCIRKTHLKEARVDLDYCQFKGLCQIYESKVCQLNLSHAELGGGLLINHSSFYDLVSADHIKAKGIFELSSNAFFQGASFQKALLNTRFSHVDTNLFYSAANFNDSIITSDNYFLNNYFHKDILLLNVDFQQSFSFADNIIGGMIRLKSRTRKISPQPATLDIPPQKNEARSTASSIQNTSQFEVITQKINAISKRIRSTNSQTSSPSLSQANALVARHRSDPEKDLDLHQETQVNKSHVMNNEQEAFHAFCPSPRKMQKQLKLCTKSLPKRGSKFGFRKFTSRLEIA